MKPEQIIEVVQGYIDGKTIQYKTAVGWGEASTPLFNFTNDDYRIKPEPRTFQLTMKHDGMVIIHNYNKDLLIGEVIKVIEVLEDE